MSHFPPVVLSALQTEMSAPLFHRPEVKKDVRLAIIPLREQVEIIDFFHKMKKRQLDELTTSKWTILFAPIPDSSRQYCERRWPTRPSCVCSGLVRLARQRWPDHLHPNGHM